MKKKQRKILNLAAITLASLIVANAQAAPKGGDGQMQGMPGVSGGSMAGMKHGTGGACATAELKCASTVTPLLASDGKLWLAFDVDNKVYVSHSSDLGKTVSTAVAVTPEKVHLDTGPDARASIAIDEKGRVFVAYAIFKDSNFNAEVFFSRSLDGGKSFSAPRPLVPDSTASQRFAALAVSPGGNLFATWLDKRGVVEAAKQGKTYDGAAIAYSWSKDGGAIFSPSRIAHDNSCECCRIGVGFNGPDQPVVVFRNVFPGMIRDHALLSFKNADTPGPLERVAVDDWHLNGCPHHGPSISIAKSGTYHVVWFTQGDAHKGLFYARSTDKGAHFSQPMALGNPDHDLTRPYVASVPGTTIVVWKEFDGEVSAVNMRVSHDDGVTWSKPRQIAKTDDASDHPLLVNDGHQIFLSWMTKGDGYHLSAIKDAPMKKLIAAALALLPAVAQADELHPFARGSWKDLTRAHAGKPTVVHFWGLTCGPCLAELPDWTAQLKKRPDLKLVLVDSSPFGDEPGEVKAALARAGLMGQENWLFADSFEERLRFEIDPKWRGEMPYTLMIGRDGKVEKVTGVMDFKKLDAWLNTQAKKS